MRIRKKPWAAAEITGNSFVVQNPAEMRGKWHEAFQNNRDINVELGMGKGKFIIEKAASDSLRNYIGIERQVSVFASAARRIQHSGSNQNIRAVLANASDAAEIFAENEVSELYINFFYPWPKSRWEKRRLTHRGFLSQYTRILKNGGALILKTDSRLLFDFTIGELEFCGWKLESCSYDLHKELSSCIRKANIMTEYEQKFAERGMCIYMLSATTPSKSGG